MLDHFRNEKEDESSFNIGDIVECVSSIDPNHGGPKAGQRYTVTSVKGRWVGFPLETLSSDNRLYSEGLRKGSEPNWGSECFKLVSGSPIHTLIRKANEGAKAIHVLFEYASSVVYSNALSPEGEKKWLKGFTSDYTITPHFIPEFALKREPKLDPPFSIGSKGFNVSLQEGDLIIGCRSFDAQEAMLGLELMLEGKTSKFVLVDKQIICATRLGLVINEHDADDLLTWEEAENLLKKLKEAFAKAGE